MTVRAPKGRDGHDGRSSLRHILATTTDDDVRDRPPDIETTTLTTRLADPAARRLLPVDGIEVPIAPPVPEVDTGTRLATALLGYMAVLIAVVTLLPFRFAVPTSPRIVLAGGLFDLVANVALFAPLGFLYALTRRDGISARRVFVLALIASATIESIQMFEVTRYASVSDVLANGVGAWLGALGQQRLARHIAMDARTVGRLSLELPLMGLVYLLVPLLWLDGLAGIDSSAHLWTLLALGAFGASLLAAAQRHHFGPNRLLTRGVMTGLGCAWFLVGAFPGLAPRASIVMFAMLAAVGAFLYARSSVRTSARPINRRFESRALTESAPFYAAYLVLLVAPPLGYGVVEWRGAFGFDVAAGEWTTGMILRVVEAIAAFTLLGYMIAELRGRREARFREGVREIAQWSLAVALMFETFEGLHPDSGASILRLVLLVASSLYGAWLYHLQRAHVRRLLGRS